MKYKVEYNVINRRATRSEVIEIDDDVINRGAFYVVKALENAIPHDEDEEVELLDYKLEQES